MTDRVLIVGAGAIGGMFAGYLAAAGRPVTVLARGENAQVIARDGIRLSTPDQQSLHGRPRVVTRGAEAGVHDIVLLTTKAFSLPAAMSVARDAIGPDTLVSPVVNGVPWWFGTTQAPIRAVDPDGSLSAAMAPDQLVGGTTYSPAHRPGPGQWAHTVPGKLTVGPSRRGGSMAGAERIARAFEGTAFGAVAVPDVHHAVWAKLMTNAAFNPLCALTGARQIDVARDPELGRAVQSIMREIAALARAFGCDIEAGAGASFDQAYHKGVHKPSMLQDFDAGRPVELGAIVDAPLELAARAGVPMPVLQAFGAAVRLKAMAAGLLPDAQAGA